MDFWKNILFVIDSSDVRILHLEGGELLGLNVK